MAPAIYTCISLSIVYLIDNIHKFKIFVSIFILFILCYEGIYYSIVDKRQLQKEPWREMAAWIEVQYDYKNIPVYSLGYKLKSKFTLDYYLPDKKCKNLLVDTTGLYTLTKFYLVETNGHDKSSPLIKKQLDEFYNHSNLIFGSTEYGKGGIITIYSLK